MTADVISAYATGHLEELHCQLKDHLFYTKTEKHYQTTLELIRDIEVELCWRERANGVR